MWNPLCIVFGHRKVKWVEGSHGSRVGTVTYHERCIRRFCGWKREWWKRVPARLVTRLLNEE